MTQSAPAENPNARQVRLRMTAAQHETLKRHLFPGDDREGIVIVLCGRAGIATDEILLVHELTPIPYSECLQRSESRVQWRTDRLPALLERASRDNLGFLKIHSHPNGFLGFSSTDDKSDRDLFPSISGWTNTSRPHLSAVMTPDGAICARVVDPAGHFESVSRTMVVGDQLIEWSDNSTLAESAGSHYSVRTSQAFGEGTTRRLSRMSIGVVGCSGTGSWVVELLARLGVGELVLVDADVVEPVNMNRIIHATVHDAATRRPKVEVLADAVRATGLPTRVEPILGNVITPSVVRRLSRCDALLGCVDSLDARDLLGRLSTFYSLPYVDVGVRLIADGLGGISHIAGSANYIHPEAPSLLDRGVYTAKQLADAGLHRSDPSAHAAQVKARYITGAAEDRPAVASVNAFYASLAVNELLARVHPYRDEDAPLGVTISLTQLRVVLPEKGTRSLSLAKKIGRGDARPLLGLPILSE